MKVSLLRRFSPGKGTIRTLLIAGAMLFTIQARLAHAGEKVKECLVNKIKYINKGAYIVYPVLKYIRKDGEKKAHHAVSVVLAGESIIDNLDDPIFGVKPLKDGQEVWLLLKIEEGEKESCRKDIHKLIYKKGINKTMKFKSGGTTLLYNRCKYNGNMDNDCYTE